VRICDAFREAGFWFRVGDYQLRLTCPCGARLQLDACTTSERDGVTLYACPTCAAPLAGVAADEAVAPAPGVQPDDDGHHMCGYVFGANVDIELWPPAAHEPYMTIQRRPGFFSARELA
jgi:hypothetical protein